MTSGIIRDYTLAVGTYSGIEPGIQNTAKIGTIAGIPITGDLGPGYNNLILKLDGYDYTSIGGNPFSASHYGLSLKGASVGCAFIAHLLL